MGRLSQVNDEQTPILVTDFSFVRIGIGFLGFFILGYILGRNHVTR